MKLNNKEEIAKRPYKTIYKDGDRLVKVFSKEWPKGNVFNEALNQANVEATGLTIPKVLEVSDIDGQWAIASEFVEGTTMEALMNKEGYEKYLEKFVDLQLDIHSKHAPMLNKLKDKMLRKIAQVDVLDATTRYELATRIEGMPKHNKVCHGDFNPSNVIVGKNGELTIIDWSHATQGNASADAAMTYLEFALKDEKLANDYLNLFCKKSDTAKQYVQQWLPIVAAYSLTKNGANTEFLLKWADVCDYE